MIDGGHAFGNRGGGYSYGWSTNHTDAVVDRNVNADQLIDTNVGVKKAAKWEIAVPNGQYTVTVGVGDAGAASNNNIWVEGAVNLFVYTVLGANQFSARTATVNVTDGRLTIGIGGSATGATRINYLDLTSLATSPPPTLPPAIPPTVPPAVPPAVPPTVPTSGIKINYQPSVVQGVIGYLVDGGQTFGNRGNGQTYGWSASHADATIDRNINSDQKLDTHIGVKSGAKWELAVANGTYTVTIGVGDAGGTSRNNIWVEGSSNLFAYVDLAANQFLTRSATVTVTDGRLTLGFGGAATGATRIDFIEIA